jgi:hypothetical protein
LFVFLVSLDFLAERRGGFRKVSEIDLIDFVIFRFVVVVIVDDDVVVVAVNNACHRLQSRDFLCVTVTAVAAVVAVVVVVAVVDARESLLF